MSQLASERLSERRRAWLALLLKTFVYKRLRALYWRRSLHALAYKSVISVCWVTLTSFLFNSPTVWVLGPMIGFTEGFIKNKFQATKWPLSSSYDQDWFNYLTFCNYSLSDSHKAASLNRHNTVLAVISVGLQFIVRSQSL